MRMELLRTGSGCLLTCSSSLLLAELSHLLLVEGCLGRRELPCHDLLRSLRLLSPIRSLLLGLLHHVEGGCLPHGRGLSHLSLSCG